MTIPVIPIISKYVFDIQIIAIFAKGFFQKKSKTQRNCNLLQANCGMLLHG